jgi:predicted RNA-binding protein with RPS1 domain
VKKPKHLKRKLEQLSPNDDQTRKVVLKEIEEFQSTKAQFAGEAVSKRQKVNTETKTDTASKTYNTAVNSQKSNTYSKNMGAPKESAVVDKDLAGIDKIVEDVKKNMDENAKSSSGHSSDVDSDDEQDADTDQKKEEVSRRERGRRRRGRKDTAMEIKEKQEAVEQEQKVKEKKFEREEATSGEAPATERYCIGRKPVTDFAVGQKHLGKVVYVKEFGVFFDIGCHSDAFCHVSRLRDDFVENPQELFKEGDEVQTRVVEIDRKRKRITISLQSDERAADEQVSAQAREERKKSRKSSRRKNPKPNEAEDAPGNNIKRTGTDQDISIKERTSSSSISIKQAVVAPTNHIPSSRMTRDVQLPPSNSITPAEQKRARKLARRAARRDDCVVAEESPS